MRSLKNRLETDGKSRKKREKKGSCSPILDYNHWYCCVINGTQSPTESESVAYLSDNNVCQNTKRNVVNCTVQCRACLFFVAHPSKYNDVMGLCLTSSESMMMSGFLP